MKKIISFAVLLAMLITSVSIVSAYSGASTERVTGDFQIGDVNKDGIINVKDAVIIQRKIVNKENFSDENLYIADANGDGNITVADATSIQKYACKMISSLPNNGQEVTTTTSTTNPPTTHPTATTKPTLTTDPEGYFDIVVKP